MQKIDHESIMYNELNLIPITAKNEDRKAAVTNTLHFTHHLIYLLVIYLQRVKQIKFQVMSDILTV